jgi:hypothetical protein
VSRDAFLQNESQEKTMTRSLRAAALVLAGVAIATTAMMTSARADANGSGLFLLRTATSQGDDTTRTYWTGTTYTLDVDPTLRARWTYDALAALPETESKVRTYDVKPLIAAVTYKTLNLSSSMQLTFITSRSLVMADLGKGASLSLDPKSIHSGTVSFQFSF